jgi:formylglycine-generating enzyme required for sulfatase activity
VTQAAFENVMGYNPSSFQDDPKFPVESVGWDEADAYCTAIGGRLPSAAEWEYAARAGTTAPRYGNLDDIAWYLKNSDFTIHEVAKKKPNAFGLYDMLGNVSEWTHTLYEVQLNQENINPTGPSYAEYRELRGGGWWDEPDLVRASYRSRVQDETEDFGLGLRCVSE